MLEERTCPVHGEPFRVNPYLIRGSSPLLTRRGQGEVVSSAKRYFRSKFQAPNRKIKKPSFVRFMKNTTILQGRVDIKEVSNFIRVENI